MDKNLEQKKSKSLLKFALEEELLQDKDMLKYTDETENPHIFSERHNKRMKRIFKMADKVERRSVYRRKYYQVAAGVALFLCFSTFTITQVEAFRLPILKFFMQIKEKSTQLRVDTDNGLVLSDEYRDYELGYVPDGYVVVQLDQNDSGFTILYNSEYSSNWFGYKYHKQMESMNINSETATITEIDIKNQKAVIVQTDNEIEIVINIGMKRFSIEGSITYDDAIKIMESINY